MASFLLKQARIQAKFGYFSDSLTNYDLFMADLLRYLRTLPEGEEKDSCQKLKDIIQQECRIIKEMEGNLQQLSRDPVPPSHDSISSSPQYQHKPPSTAPHHMPPQQAFRHGSQPRRQSGGAGFRDARPAVRRDDYDPRHIGRRGAYGPVKSKDPSDDRSDRRRSGGGVRARAAPRASSGPSAGRGYAANGRGGAVPRAGSGEKKKSAPHIGGRMDYGDVSGPVPEDGEEKYVAEISIHQQYVEQIELEILDHSPGITWEMIVGLEDAKLALRKAAIFPLIMKDFFTGKRKPWKGVLLYGPPGTGKTMLAKAVATSSEARFFNISTSTFASKYRGEPEIIARLLFKMARFYAPSIIFIDEVDALVSQRGKSSEHEASRRLKSVFLTEMEGLSNDDDKRVIVIGATNFPWDIDDAMKRRFQKRVYIPMPDRNARRSIFVKETESDKKESKEEAEKGDVSDDDSSGDFTHSKGGIKISSDVDFDKLADLTEGYSCADITGICHEAFMMPLNKFESLSLTCIKERLEKESLADVPVTMKDFMDVLEDTDPSLSPAKLKVYEEWKKKLGKK
ncbi:Katanin p60 ATPase-containing subunit A1 [Aduncisulcus paluster]|uniref:Katanin p60 ATPase-containing subunit A1 n=1 Tax=Aduncisulcus paluster TaxID=2918883 RepID=A0ABQ5K4B0_9EUKA|nr:Katanin p60 ATPase-containing subunit A1 [Aduncisulcus paluster]